MAKPSNDKIERHYFEQFRKMYALPEGRVEHRDKPDVILHDTSIGKVGIEITNFFIQPGNLPESEQRQRPLREKGVAEAHKLFLASGGKNIELTLGFDKKTPIALARMRTLSKDLAVFARSCDSQRSGEIYRSQFRDIMPEISSIYVNANEYTDAKWRIMQVHSVGLMSKDDLDAIAREKESKLAEYERCNVYWLLVVVDGIDAAQEQEIRIEDLLVSSGVFERIIVFHTFGHVVEITAAA